MAKCNELGLLTYIFFICLWLPCLAEKIRFLSTEHPVVSYYNKKYLNYANLTTRRFGRKNPFYYVGLHFDILTSFGNNVSVDFYFYEFLTNRYKPSFVEMHFRFCNLVHNDKFFGNAMKQGKLDGPCPYPPGQYHLYNMTIPTTQIPKAFPFTKGRIYANFSAVAAQELIAAGYIDMEMKETRLK